MTSTATTTNVVAEGMDVDNLSPMFKNAFTRVKGWIVHSSQIKFDRKSTPIREGLYTDVYDGTFLFSDVTVVKYTTKKTGVSSRELLEEVLREVQLLLRITCDFVVPIQRISIDDELLLAQERSKYTLQEHIGSCPNLNLKAILELALPVLKGLNFIHSHEIIMGNLKPESIAIMTGGKAKIATLGHAAHKDESYLASGAGPRYSAPEVLEDLTDIDPEQKTKADVYSFGCLLSFMLLGGEESMYPKRLKSENDYIDYVVEKGYKPSRPPLSSDKMTPTLNTFLDLCLEHSYALRPRTEDLVPVLLKCVYESFSPDHSGMTWWKINFGGSDSSVCPRTNWDDFAEKIGLHHTMNLGQLKKAKIMLHDGDDQVTIEKYVTLLADYGPQHLVAKNLKTMLKQPYHYRLLNDTPLANAPDGSWIIRDSSQGQWTASWVTSKKEVVKMKVGYNALNGNYFAGTDISAKSMKELVESLVKTFGLKTPVLCCDYCFTEAKACAAHKGSV